MGEHGGGGVAGGIRLAEGLGAGGHHVEQRAVGEQGRDHGRQVAVAVEMDGRAVAYQHFGVAAFLAGQGADDQHGGSGGHGLGGGQAAGLADQQAGATHDRHGVLDIAADADGVPEPVARSQQFLAQAPVGAGDDVDGEVGGGTVKERMVANRAPRPRDPPMTSTRRPASREMVLPRAASTSAWMGMPKIWMRSAGVPRIISRCMAV